MMRVVALVGTMAAQSAAACPAPQGAIALSAVVDGAPSGYAVIKDLPLSAPFEVEVAFCDAAGRLVKELAFDAIMPAHQHGMNYSVNVANLEGNRFVVSKVVFHMPGLWQLNITADLGDQVFDYVAQVPLE